MKSKSPVLAFLKAVSGGTRMAVKIQPNARVAVIKGMVGDSLKIQIPAPAVDNKANEALIGFLSERLDVRRNRIQITQGATSRNKGIFIEGMSPEEIASKLF